VRSPDQVIYISVSWGRRPLFAYLSVDRLRISSRSVRARRPIESHNPTPNVATKIYSQQATSGLKIVEEGLSQKKVAGSLGADLRRLRIALEEHSQLEKQPPCRHQLPPKDRCKGGHRPQTQDLLQICHPARYLHLNREHPHPRRTWQMVAVVEGGRM
jgi:hypothetical protein